MDISGYHTTKNKISESKKGLNIPTNSSNNSIKRRKSFLPRKYSHLGDKINFSSKKMFKKSFSRKSFSKEIENKININKDKKIGSKSGKISKLNEINNNYFDDLTKNVYMNESHINKDDILKKSHNIINKTKSHLISKKDINNNYKRKSDTNKFILPLFNMKKNLEKKNLEKDVFSINSNYKASFLNHKLNNNIYHLLDKENLTKEEKGRLLHYYIDKHKQKNNIQKQTINESNNKSSIFNRKKKNKHNHKAKVIEQNKNLEKQKTEKEIPECNKNNNLLINNIIPKTKKINIFFQAFLCCLKTN